MTSRRGFFSEAAKAILGGAAIGATALSAAAAVPAEKRGTLHIRVGQGWNPTAEELQQYVDLFQEADMDPLGAIIATPRGVSVTRI